MLLRHIHLALGGNYEKLRRLAAKKGIAPYPNADNMTTYQRWSSTLNITILIFTSRTLLVHFLGLVTEDPNLSVSLDKIKYLAILKLLDSSVRKLLREFYNLHNILLVHNGLPWFHCDLNPLRMLGKRGSVEFDPEVDSSKHWWLFTGHSFI